MATRTAPQDPADRTRYTETEYHAKHRTQLPDLAAQIRLENDVWFPQFETHGADHV